MAALSSLRDASTDTVTRSDAPNWLDRAACAAAGDVGRVADATTILQVRRLADRGRVGAWVCLGILAGLGAVSGGTTAAKLLRSGDGTVNVAYALLLIVATPGVQSGRGRNPTVSDLPVRTVA